MNKKSRYTNVITITVILMFVLSSITVIAAIRTFETIGRTTFNDVERTNIDNLEEVVVTDRGLGATGDTIYVDDDNTEGPWNGTLDYPYQYIQDGIDNASSGGTIFVFNGTYYENVIVNKSINLIGEDKNTTIIDGRNATSNIVCIYVDWVNISGFTIRYSMNAGIFVTWRSNNTITGNIIVNTKYGIDLIRSASNNIISGNTISTIYYVGIRLRYSSDNNIIANNTIANNGWCGIRTSYSSCNTISENTITNNNRNGVFLLYSSDNTIYGNTITNNTITNNNENGIHIGYLSNDETATVISGNIITNNNQNGIYIGDTSDNVIYGNTIASNNENGISVGHSPGNAIYENTIMNNNQSGIILPFSSHNAVSGNTITNNSNDGIEISYSHYNNIYENTITNNNEGIEIYYESNNNIIYHNNLINNTQNAKDSYTNTWDDGYPSGGNYWSDYVGTDSDGDGIGDTPYSISGGNNQDNFPLIYEWGDQLPVAYFNFSVYHYSSLFDASSSYDRDGTIVSYDWDFGDNTTGTGIAIISHNYSQSGTYNVTLMVTDDDDKNGSWSQVVTVIDNQLPYDPSNPYPSDGAMYVDPDAVLSWNCSDPDGDPLTYNVYFEANDSTPDVLVSNNQSEKWYDPGVMDYNIHYYWQIVAWDNYNGSTSGPLWDFTIEGPNNPPNAPGSPNPVNGATGVNIDANLSWVGGDPDPGDTVTYDVYFGTGSPPPKVAGNQSGTTYDPGTLNYCTAYYWQIVAWDNHGASTSGPEWNFKTNCKPNVPSDPNPENGATGIDIDADLSWSCSDPDGHSLTYDVYFEADDPTPDVLVSDNQPDTSYDPGTLDYETAYYWQIIAEDEYGATTTGPIWHFTTEEEPEPDLDCDGTLSWTDVSPGSTVTGSFTVENIGEPTSLLDWEITEWPSWGNGSSWAFTPLSGDDLTPEDGPVTVNVSVVAPDVKNSDFSGQVKIENKENSSDFCTIDVSLVTPVNQNTLYSQFLQFLQKIIHRFPLLEQILSLFPFFNRILNL